MTITAGKHYRTRGGYKATIYATNKAGNRPIHGSVHQEGVDFVYSWHANGHRSSDVTVYDIIEEWDELPIMDLSTLPRWASYIKYDTLACRWYWLTTSLGQRDVIPADYAPTNIIPDRNARYYIDRPNNRLVKQL